MSVLKENQLLQPEIRIPSSSTVNKYGLSLDRLTIKHGEEFIEDAIELRLGLDGSTTRNKNVIAAGLTNEKNEFFGLGFIEIPAIWKYQQFGICKINSSQFSDAILSPISILRTNLTGTVLSVPRHCDRSNIVCKISSLQ